MAAWAAATTSTTRLRQRRLLSCPRSRWSDELPEPDPLGRRTDNDLWARPGDRIDETISECARREVREETGIDVEVQGIMGRSDPGHVFSYDDGEVRQEFWICFSACPVAGTFTVGDESHDVRYFTSAEIPGWHMVESNWLRVTDHLETEGPRFVLDRCRDTQLG